MTLPAGGRSLRRIVSTHAAAQGIDAEAFREVFGGVPAAVAVVATVEDGRPHGTTVSSFTALSLDPPLVLVSLDRGSQLLATVRRTGHFSLNLLAVDQGSLALSFARKGDDKFDGVEWTHTPGGFARLAGGAGWIAASLEWVMPGGDHEILIGRALDSDRRESRPLVYHSRSFHDLHPVEP